MFRPLRRKKRAITDEEARKLLATCKRGVFAVNGDDGYPYAIPVNYFFDAEHDKIYFHGAKAGHKVDASAMTRSALPFTATIAPGR
ncbi:MAG: pyridoxamine 5'-phosphate oxidase family protein [Collinsella sp.]